MSVKVTILNRCISIPIFRRIIRKVFIPSHFFYFTKMIEARMLFKYLNTPDKSKICDIACGCGEHCLQLARKGYEVYGVDLDEKSIKIADALSSPQCSFIKANAEALPFNRETFDNLVSLGALEHFRDGDQAIKEMSRVLKPQGKLFMTVDSFNYKGVNKHLQEKHKVRHQVISFYTVSSLKPKLEQNGFKIEKAKYFVNSPLSSFFYNLLIRNTWLGMLLFPLSYPLSIISDKMLGKEDEGYFLALVARKASEAKV